MADWYSLLACPNCGGDLARAEGALRCAGGHSFDIARQGYVNLLPGGAHTGTADTKEMVAARTEFLARGHFAPLDAALADVVAEAVAGVGGCIADVGAGTGEHLVAVLERLPERIGLALDVSKHAARRAAKAHPRIGVVVCDAWGVLPVRDGVVAAVMSMFAPRNAAEFARILAPGGALVVVTPTDRHLAEIIGPLGMISVDPRKDERLEEALAGRFEREGTRVVEGELQLSHADALAVVMMGPSAHHVDPDEARQRAEALLEPLAATLSVSVSVWRAAEE
jgi:SAM-dependent methyltransferase